MRIPQCLVLNAHQLAILTQFEKDHPTTEDETEEDCCMSSRFSFTCYSAGIGDVVHVSCGTGRIWLDDGCEP